MSAHDDNRIAEFLLAPSKDAKFMREFEVEYG